MRYITTFLAITLSALTAHAEVIGPKRPYDPAVEVSSSAFTALAINTAKTFDDIEVNGFRFINLDLAYTNSAGTAVTMTCTHSRTSGGTDFAIHAIDVLAGTATSYPLTWSNAVSGNENWTWRVNVHGYKFVQCSFTATGGDGNDKLTVTATLGVD